MQEIMNTKQAAEYLGYSEITLKLARSTGILGGKSAPQYVKAGRAVRYHREDLVAWIAQFEKRTETEKNG